MIQPDANQEQPSRLEQLKDRIIVALAPGRGDDHPSLSALTRQMADAATDDPRTFKETLNALAYHGRLDLMVEMMETAWPQIQEEGEQVPQLVSEFAARATDHILFQHLARHDTPDAQDPALRARLERFFPVNPGNLNTYLKLLSGRVGRPWSMEDFTPPDAQQLGGLTLEFVGYAHHAEAIPYPKADLARHQFPRYFLDRQAGRLYPREDVAALLRQGRRPRGADPEPEHPLCPDRATLDKFLRNLLETLYPQPYAAATTFEMVPVWLRFLEGRGLVDTVQKDRTLRDVATIVPDIRAIWEEEYAADPALRQGTDRWQQNAGLLP